MIFFRTTDTTDTTDTTVWKPGLTARLVSLTRTAGTHHTNTKELTLAVSSLQGSFKNVAANLQCFEWTVP